VISLNKSQVKSEGTLYTYVQSTLTKHTKICTCTVLIFYGILNPKNMSIH